MPPRFAAIDGLRAICALYVVLHHCMLFCWQQGANTPGAPWWTHLLEHGHYAVTAFIVISGYCMTATVARAGWTLPWGILGYYARRARRILPPFYAAMALCIVLLLTIIGHKTGTRWDNLLPFHWFHVVPNLLMQQDWWLPGKINGVFWSLAVEEKIYLLLPVVLLCYRRCGAFWSAIVLIGLSLALAYAWCTHAVLSRLTIQYWACFAIGTMAVSVMHDPAPVWAYLRARTPWRIVLILAAAGFLWLLLRHRRIEADAVLAVAVATVLMRVTSPHHGALRRMLSWRPLACIGLFSYSLYLIHAPLQQVIMQYAIRPLGIPPAAMFALLTGLGVPLILAASYGFFLIAERPFMSASRAATSPEATAARPKAAV